MAKIAVASKILIISAFGLMASAQAGNLIRGKVSGYQLKDKDDRIDGAVVFQSLKASSLMGFQINDLMGPDEKMKAGPLSEEVPGNLHFPTQKEKWGIFPVTLSKEQFVVPYKPGESSELFAMRFSVPFGAAVDKRNAPYNQLLSLVNLRGYGMTEMRDWSHAQNIEIVLDRSPQVGAAYTWNRDGFGDHEWEALIAFQADANKRWVVSDFQPSPDKSGVTRKVPGLEADSAYLFLRMLDNKDHSSPIAMAANFVRSRDASVGVDGVAPYLQGVSVSGKTVNWAPINESGWMAVMRGTSSTKLKVHSNNPYGVFGRLGFDRIMRFGAPLMAWVSPTSGHYELDSPLTKNDTLTVLFVKTDADVAMPDANDPSDDPELFQHAREMRAQIIQ